MIKPGNFKKATAIVGLVIVMLLITNCSSSDEPTPLPTSVSTNIPEPTVSNTPMPTPTSVSTPEPPPSDTPTPIPTRRVIPELNSEPIVQYSADANRKFAQELADAKNYKIARAYSEADIETSTKWILVGGQYANPVYQQVFGDALTQQDSGFAVIHITGHVLNENRRIVWGVAGWNESDSNASVDYVLENGLPDSRIRR